ncbi:MAG TPA: hemerythrin domain-containing protein [Allosphingosinicella sp.]|nr:hemerythrin domain-containing protein [Allosphingosinicella sp.]
MEDLTEFRAAHWQLGALMDGFAAWLEHEAAPEPLGFLHFRRDFSRLLTQHLKREDWLLYPRLRASPRADLRAAAARIQTEIGAFETWFAAYGRHWTSARIAADWPGFRAETMEMLRRLRHRIALEETELYPLLEGPLTLAR